MDEGEKHLSQFGSQSELLPTTGNGSVPHGLVHRLRVRDGSQPKPTVGDRQGKPTFSDFATTEAGIHGLTILGNPKNHKLRRGIWLVLILTSCTLLIWALVDRVQKYREYEFSTQVTLKYQRQLQFPAVTICNFNPFLQSKTNGTVDRAVLSLLRPKLAAEDNVTRLTKTYGRREPGNPSEPGKGEGSPAGGGFTRQKRSVGDQNPLRRPTTQPSGQMGTSSRPTVRTVLPSGQNGTQSQSTKQTNGLGKTTQTPAPTSKPKSGEQGSHQGNGDSSNQGGKLQQQLPGINLKDKWKTLTDDEFLSLTEEETNELLANVSVQEFFLEHGHQIEDMLLSCSWRNQNCSASDFVRTFTTYGNCYTFNSDQGLYASQAGAGNGLELILDAQQSDYLQGIADQEAGFRILPHTKYESPALAVDSLGFAAAPGTKSFVGISFKKVVNLPKPYNDMGCKDTSSLMHLESYTAFNCLLECYSDLTEQFCGCRTIYMPGSNESYCNPLQTFQCAEAVRDAIIEGNNNTFTCDHCTQPCSYDSYTFSLSSTVYPSSQSVVITDKTKKNNFNLILQDKLLSDRRNNHVRLSIYFEELNFQEVKQIPAYDMLSLLSDFGGLAGVLLGASILAFAEFADFFVRLAIFSFPTLCLWKMRNELKVQQKDLKNMCEDNKDVDELQLTENWSMLMPNS